MIPLLLIFSDIGIFIVRIVAGAVMIAHGFRKIKDLKTNAHNFENMGFRPASFWGTLVAIVEFFGGIGFIIGFFTQIIAGIFILEFVVILIKQFQWKTKFVGGYELDLAILASTALLFTNGGGAFSLDSMVRWIL